MVPRDLPEIWSILYLWKEKGLISVSLLLNHRQRVSAPYQKFDISHPWCKMIKGVSWLTRGLRLKEIHYPQFQIRQPSSHVTKSPVRLLRMGSRKTHGSVITCGGRCVTCQVQFFSHFILAHTFTHSARIRADKVLADSEVFLLEWAPLWFVLAGCSARWLVIAGHSPTKSLRTVTDIIVTLMKRTTLIWSHETPPVFRGASRWRVSVEKASGIEVLKEMKAGWT